MSPSALQFWITPTENARLAGILYTEYSRSVGGVAFNGDPLPSWEEFVNEGSKAKQVIGWHRVSGMAFEFAIKRLEAINAGLQLPTEVKSVESIRMVRGEALTPLGPVPSFVPIVKCKRCVDRSVPSACLAIFASAEGPLCVGHAQEVLESKAAGSEPEVKCLACGVPLTDENTSYSSLCQKCSDCGSQAAFAELNRKSQG